MSNANLAFKKVVILSAAKSDQAAPSDRRNRGRHQGHRKGSRGHTAAGDKIKESELVVFVDRVEKARLELPFQRGKCGKFELSLKLELRTPCKGEVLLGAA